MVHGCMVYTERAETAAVSCGTSHASAVSTRLRWIFKNALKKKVIHSCRNTYERNESARERRIALYKSDPPPPPPPPSESVWPSGKALGW